MPYPEALKENPKIIFFSDFDGTITLKDTNALGRDSFREMMESVKTPFPECIRLLCENIKLDPYFKDFYQWSRENKVPVIVLSSGMTPIIRSLLVHLVGPEAHDIEIVSNEVVDKPGKTKDQEDGWQLKYHDNSGFGHDKSLTIRPYAEHFAARPNEPRPTMLYAGDGVSDLSAARETDLLFAKKGHDLITYCEREGIPFTVFEDWQSILGTTKDILRYIQIYDRVDLSFGTSHILPFLTHLPQAGWFLVLRPILNVTATMRLTAELIQNSLSYLNPLKERELDLRGHKIPNIENLGVAKDQDAIDFTDNDITAISNFPLSPRLNTLLLARNRVNSIQATLANSIPNLTTLVLTSNNMAELADLDPLRNFPQLTHLSLLENPVTRKEHYRYWIIWRCPTIRFLDYQKVKDVERNKAAELFGTVKEPSALASKIMGIKSRTFDIPGASASAPNGIQTGDKSYRVKLTEKEKERVEGLIRNAKSLQEITRLEKELNEGRVPGGGGDEDRMEE
ncbi:MAG: hypothetical protein Q9166_006625 [cf. Caloplaca sp. 2 TL-2023]